MPSIRPSKFKKEDKLAGRVRLEVSLAFELIMVVRRYVHPSFLQGDQPERWLQKVRRHLSPQTQQTLEQLGFVLPLSMGLFPAASRSVEAFLEMLEAIPAEEFLDYLQGLHDLDPATEMVVNKLRLGEALSAADLALEADLPEGATSFEQIIQTAPIWTDSARLKSLLIAALRDLYESYLQREFERVRPILETSASQARALLETNLLPTEQLIEGLTHGFTLSQETEYSYVVLSPSFYSAPYVELENLRGGGVLLLYPARPEGMSLDGTYVDHDRLMQRLKSLADDTRLEILRLLAHRPYNTQELAVALGRSQPTISHHMSDLRVAGLVRVELQNNSKLYTLYPDFVDQLAAELKAMLKIED